MNGILKIGQVESVQGRRVKVRLKGSRTALAEMTVLKNGSTATGSGGDPLHRHEIGHWMPSVGDQVVCLMIPEGAGQGFVIGAI